MVDMHLPCDTAVGKANEGSLRQTLERPLGRGTAPAIWAASCRVGAPGTVPRQCPTLDQNKA